jgi:hypothetical protein
MARGSSPPSIVEVSFNGGGNRSGIRTHRSVIRKVTKDTNGVSRRRRRTDNAMAKSKWTQRQTMVNRYYIVVSEMFDYNTSSS